MKKLLLVLSISMLNLEASRATAEQIQAERLRQEAQQAETSSSATTSTAVPNVGAASPTTNKSMEYAYIYSQSNQSVNYNEGITFELNGEISSGFKHGIDKLSDIVFGKAGTYQVTFLATVSNSQFSYPVIIGLFLNDTLVNGSRQSLQVTTYVNKISSTIQSIITVNAGDKLTVRNCEERKDNKLQIIAVGSKLSTSASILITQIA